MNEKLLKVGDLVTVNFGQFNAASNTYKIEATLKKGNFLLTNPITTDCYIVKHHSELNTVLANIKTPIENCITYLQQNRQYLGYVAQADLDSIIYYFLIKRELTPKQKDRLATMYAKICSIALGNDLKLAVEIVKANLAILDEFNMYLFNSLKPCIDDLTKVDSDIKRIGIYKLAGFCLAQIEIK